ncbi:hypothetical protein BO94DRAFT_471931 [Aspergillus sclerotioniger CBS 115572]|uniref:Zn(2)-C6 fungal-type domain-containing protein n=1 Tax=Aspergillus sclerotioniger CBS 115572 TaxID=1450535 RepID=A0A317VVN1_9EURO|nr:hypothetical protein BO94DRAFT_471931 [Aspergillus sclerotioniger CBS 115572]PWY78444.1 hypothetical protein BO94DRAFT_471931 [Aspergillus sclerotioniger CBS 115572]
MPRRQHKKSRNGCLECKRRHIKCDERRPVCAQCTTSERICEFSERHARIVLSAASSRQTPSSTTGTPLSEPAVAAGSHEEPPVNMLHAELLCHLVTETLGSLSRDNSHLASLFSTEIMKCCSEAPYLLNELLALAATHISIIRPAQQALYRHHAAQLQNHALRFFHATNPTPTSTPTACMPRFLFSSILGMHTLCDTLVFRDDDFNVFLDRFIHYLHIHRGVRAVIGSNWRVLAESTALAPTLGDAESRLQADNAPLGPECSRLLALTQSSNLSPSIAATYQHAIEALQLAMNSASSLEPMGSCPPGIFSWPATLSPEYVDLLALRSPDALAVLAHYGVVLHAHRHHWFLGDGGRYLIESIREYLGPDWAEWLAFPNHALSQSTIP